MFCFSAILNFTFISHKYRWLLIVLMLKLFALITLTDVYGHVLCTIICVFYNLNDKIGLGRCTINK